MEVIFSSNFILLYQMGEKVLNKNNFKQKYVKSISWKLNFHMVLVYLIENNTYRK